MIPKPDQCCQHRIVEGTKSEVLGVARVAPPHVVRWADDRVPDQRWVLVPVDDDDGHGCRIVNAENGNDLRLQESTASEYHASVEYTAEMEIPAERFIVGNWVLVNAYTLYRMGRGKAVDSWDVVQSGELISDGYPRSLPARDESRRHAPR